MLFVDMRSHDQFSVPRDSCRSIEIICVYVTAFIGCIRDYLCIRNDISRPFVYYVYTIGPFHIWLQFHHHAVLQALKVRRNLTKYIMSGRGRGRRRKQNKPANPTSAKQRRTEDAARKDDDDQNNHEVVHLGGHSADARKGNSDVAFIDFEHTLRRHFNQKADDNVGDCCKKGSEIQSDCVEHDAGNVPTSVLHDVDCDIEMVRCGGDGLSAHIPDQIRQKIWQHKYINLACLLKGSVELASMYEQGGLVRVNDQGVLETKSKQVNDRIHSIEKWTDAFIIFSHIYLQKYPSKAPELLQYMSVIREAAIGQAGLAWCSYDEQFRLRQAIEPRPWDVINADLWLRIMTLGNRPGMPGRAVSATQSSASQLHCLDFNNNQCLRSFCKYAHVCANCSSPLHNRLNCPRQASGNATRGRGFSPSPPTAFRGYNRGFTGNRYTRGRFLSARGMPSRKPAY